MTLVRPGGASTLVSAPNATHDLKQYQHRLLAVEPGPSSPCSASSSSLASSATVTSMQPLPLSSEKRSARRPGSAGSVSISSNAAGLIVDSDGHLHDPGYAQGLKQLHASIEKRASSAAHRSRSNTRRRRRSSLLNPNRGPVAQWSSGPHELGSDAESESGSEDEDGDASGGASNYARTSHRLASSPSSRSQEETSEADDVILSREKRGSWLGSDAPRHSFSSDRSKGGHASGLFSSSRSGSVSRTPGRRSSGGQVTVGVSPLDDWNTGGFTSIVDIEKKARRASAEAALLHAPQPPPSPPRPVNVGVTPTITSTRRGEPSHSPRVRSRAEDLDGAAAKADAKHALPPDSPLLRVLSGDDDDDGGAYEGVRRASDVGLLLPSSSASKRRGSDATRVGAGEGGKVRRALLRSFSSGREARLPSSSQTSDAAADAGVGRGRVSSASTYQTTAAPRLSTIPSAAAAAAPLGGEAYKYGPSSSSARDPTTMADDGLAARWRYDSQPLAAAPRHSISEALAAAAEADHVASQPRGVGRAATTWAPHLATPSSSSSSSSPHVKGHTLRRSLQSFALGMRFKAMSARRRLSGATLS